MALKELQLSLYKIFDRDRKGPFPSTHTQIHVRLVLGLSSYER